MAQLEYRRLDEANDYPVLYTYAALAPAEIAARFACDRLIKGGLVYEKTSCASEPLTYVIYVKEAGRAEPGGDTPPVAAGARIELRQDSSGDAPGQLMHTLDFTDGWDLVLHLQCDYLFWLGEEWLKTSLVLDEDRKVYVFYVQRSS